jgi:demethylmenaquinone methyltransferase/2-methoxy-6-polyprenyl-1,4-benzoquinol methylase
MPHGTANPTKTLRVVLAMILNKQSYRWFYDRIHSRYYDLMIKWIALPFGGEQKIRKRLLEPVSFGLADTILDLCCGTGSATFAIAEKAGDQARIIGLDLSIGQLRQASAKNPFSNVSFLQGDATSTGFPDKSFDKVFVRSRCTTSWESRTCARPFSPYFL